MNKTGREAEDLAAAHIVRHGFKIIARNVRIGSFGEIDIVAEKNKVLCIFEVKALSRSDTFKAHHHFTEKKKQKVLRLAQHIGNTYNHNEGEIAVYLLTIDNLADAPLFHIFPIFLSP